MSFLHFGLLALLPLAAIPVVLHLLTLHRLKTVELSTFRFLFDSYIQQRRRMQFLEALLAMLRTLFLVAAVLMIAGLVISSRSSLFRAAGGGKRDVILLVDCSASMKARSGGQSAFERAKSAALVVAKNLRPTDTLTLIQVGAQPHERFSNFTSDAKGVNLSWLRRFAVTLLKRHPIKDSLRGKMIRCMLNTDFLTEVLTLHED